MDVPKTQEENYSQYICRLQNQIRRSSNPSKLKKMLVDAHKQYFMETILNLEGSGVFPEFFDENNQLFFDKNEVKFE